MSQNTFWHFGDSFCFCEKIGEKKTKVPFGKIIASYLDLKYKQLCNHGASNEMIFSNILSNDFNFKEGDVVFINWSSFYRSWWIYKNKYNNEISFESTSYFLDEHGGEGIFGDDSDYFEEFIKYNISNADYLLKNNFDLNYKLFKGFIVPYLKSKEKLKIKVYNLFINDSVKLTNIKKSKNVNDIGIYELNTIKFNPNYFGWLDKNSYINEDEGHYSENIQEILANLIIKQIK